MSDYTQRMNIDTVEEVGDTTNLTSYVQRVTITEIYDQYGNKWRPAPGPDPWDEIVVEDRALLHQSNVYEIGETISVTTATFTGGTDDVTYRYRWQIRPLASGDWTSTAWTTYTNILEQASYTLASGGQVRFHCQAKDDSVEHPDIVNDFTEIKDIPYPTLTATDPVVTGLPYVGETLSSSQPVASGGLEPYQYDYFWVDESNVIVWESTKMGQTTQVIEYDIGKNMSCLVIVSSADGQSIQVQSNSIGPIEQYELGIVAPDPTAANAISGSTLTLGTTIDGGNYPSADLIYAWDIRSGEATFNGPTNTSSCSVTIDGAYPGSVQVRITVTAPNATNSPQSPVSLITIIE